MGRLAEVTPIPAASVILLRDDPMEVRAERITIAGKTTELR